MAVPLATLINDCYRLPAEEKALLVKLLEESQAGPNAIHRSWRAEVERRYTVLRGVGDARSVEQVISVLDAVVDRWRYPEVAPNAQKLLDPWPSDDPVCIDKEAAYDLLGWLSYLESDDGDLTETFLSQFTAAVDLIAQHGPLGIPWLNEWWRFPFMGKYSIVGSGNKAGSLTILAIAHRERKATFLEDWKNKSLGDSDALEDGDARLRQLWPNRCFR